MHSPSIRTRKLGNASREALNGAADRVLNDGEDFSTQNPCCGVDKWGRFRNRRACPGQPYEPTEIEQLANIITHGVSILPAAGGMLYLLANSSSRMHSVAGFLYGLSLIALFAMSTAFHCACYFRYDGRVKFVLHILDRATIFIFTACSYGPWLLLKEGHVYVVAILPVLWIMVLGAILYQLNYHERYKHFETFLYLFIGITPGLAVIPGIDDPAGLWCVAQGGAIYVFGVIFFKLDGILPLAHAIWHLFVVAGASWQFYAVTTYLYTRGDLHSLDTVAPDENLS